MSDPQPPDSQVTSPRRTGVLWGMNVAIFAVGFWMTTSWEPPRSDFPSQPIHVVVPFGTGGGSDSYARVFERAIEENNLLPVPLVIENRGGAGATIGSRYVKDAAADGYTVLLLHDAIITAKYSGMVAYGPEAFEPVACTGELGMVIAVAADSKYDTLDKLMAAAKTRPRELSFAVNRGALTHVAGLLLEQEVPGAKFQFPQSGGGNDRFVDLIGKHVDVTGFSLEEFLRFQYGDDRDNPQLIGLAYLDAERNAIIPEIPTAMEQGYDVSLINRFYWWVPKGTPEDRMEILRSTLRKALETDYVKEQMAAIHCERIFRTGDELAAQIEGTENRIRQVEFTEPTGVLNLERLTTMGIAFLLIVWSWQSPRPGLKLGVFFLLVLCLVIGANADRLNGWLLFSVLAGLVVLTPQLRAFVANTKIIACTAATLAYVACLTYGWGDFRLLTIAYAFGVGAVLVQNHRRQLPVIALLAQLLGFGLFMVFTFVFEIPLPP